MRGMAQRIETAIDTQLGNSALGIGVEDHRAGAGDTWLGTWIDASGGKARQVIGKMSEPHSLVAARLRSHGSVGQ